MSRIQTYSVFSSIMTFYLKYTVKSELISLISAFSYLCQQFVHCKASIKLHVFCLNFLVFDLVWFLTDGWASYYVFCTFILPLNAKPSSLWPLLRACCDWNGDKLLHIFVCIDTVLTAFLELSHSPHLIWWVSLISGLYISQAYRSVYHLVVIEKVFVP